MAVDSERIAVLETEMRAVQANLVEINAGIKALNAIAQRGGGALHTILLLGGVVGWLVGIAGFLMSVVKPH